MFLRRLGCTASRHATMEERTADLEIVDRVLREQHLDGEHRECLERYAEALLLNEKFLQTPLGIGEWAGMDLLGFRRPDKRLAVLCPGPSLAMPHMDATYDGAITVNRAGAMYAGGWWCFADAVAFANTERRPAQAHLFIPEETARILGENPDTHDAFSAYRVMTWERLGYHRLPHCTHNISIIAALMLARARGAVAIDLYGCDWSGTDDFDGADIGSNTAGRNDRRWAEEARVVGLVFDKFTALGIECRRIVYPKVANGR